MVVSAKKENKSVERDYRSADPGAWDAPGTGWAHWLDKKNRGVAGG